MVWLLAALTLQKLGRNGVTIVVFPLVALLRDQFNHLTQVLFGENVVIAIDESTDAFSRRTLYHRLEQNDPELRFVFISPAMFVKNTKLFKALSSCAILMFVFDEYPTLLDWVGFDSSMNQVPKLTNILISTKQIPIAFLSATGTRSHVERISSAFAIEKTIVDSPRVRPSIEHDVIFLANPVRASVVNTMAKWIKIHRTTDTPVIIFTTFTKVRPIHA